MRETTDFINENNHLKYRTFCINNLPFFLIKIMK